MFLANYLPGHTLRGCEGWVCRFAGFRDPVPVNRDGPRCASAAQAPARLCHPGHRRERQLGLPGAIKKINYPDIPEKNRLAAVQVFTGRVFYSKISLWHKGISPGSARNMLIEPSSGANIPGIIAFRVVEAHHWHNNDTSGAIKRSMMGLPSKPSQESRATQNTSPFNHLVSATVAFLILVGAVIYSDHYASSLEDKYVHALAPLELSQTYTGMVVQQAAFRQADLLPVYGSSEMLGGDPPYGASLFFATYPTGFNVIEIAKGGNSSLNIAQDLAAIGPELKGKKVVISFTPIIFTAPKVTDYAYAGNFSRLQAASLVFSPYLSMAVKQKAATRMLEYPDVISKSADPILSFALQNLARGTFYNHFLYALDSAPRPA